MNRVLAVALLGACWTGHPPAIATPAPPPEKPKPLRRWVGTCDGTDGWNVEVTLEIQLRAVDDELRVAGTAGWEERRVRLRARGPRAAVLPHRLDGTFEEIDGLGTTWNIAVELDADNVARGRLYELYASSSQLICTFDLSR